MQLTERPFIAALSRMLEPRQGLPAAPLDPWELLVEIHNIPVASKEEGVRPRGRPCPLRCWPGSLHACSSPALVLWFESLGTEGTNLFFFFFFFLIPRARRWTK